MFRKTKLLFKFFMGTPYVNCNSIFTARRSDVLPGRTTLLLNPLLCVHPSQGSHATYAFCITHVIHENHATLAAHALEQTNMPRTRSPCITLFVRLLCHLVTSFMIIAHDSSMSGFIMDDGGWAPFHQSTTSLLSRED